VIDMPEGPKRIKKYGKQVRPLIPEKDLPVHRYINSNEGAARIRRYKFMIEQKLKGCPENMPYKNKYKLILDKLVAMEHEFDNIRETHKIPPGFNLDTRRLVLGLINRELIKRKIIPD